MWHQNVFVSGERIADSYSCPLAKHEGCNKCLLCSQVMGSSPVPQTSSCHGFKPFVNL